MTTSLPSTGAAADIGGGTSWPLYVDKVLLATPRSFCAGVEMAIKALARLVELFDPPVYCYHEIVHNRLVVERFERAGVIFVDTLDEVPPGAPLMLSAHGSPPELVAAARARGGVVVNAVCPLVAKVHHEVKVRAGRGFTVLYAGHEGHDEAIGTMAVAPSAMRLVEHEADVAKLDDVEGPTAFLAQTTLSVDEWKGVLAAAQERFPDLWVPERSDLCFATTNRQAALKAIAGRSDSIVVIGSANSSNALALVKVAVKSGCERVVRVDGPSELPADLTGTVGVTAGASTAEQIVRAVVARLAPAEGVEVVSVIDETEYFPPPRDLRELLRSRRAEALLDDDAAINASDVLGIMMP
jgi:4-hydroxy-3-methylbut-2-enyl diphosphate reductase